MVLAHEHATGSAARRDFFRVGVCVLLFWWFSMAVELNERVLAWTRPFEHYQLDELPGVLLVLAAGRWRWYSWRRVGEARRELQRRVAAEGRLAETLLENRRLSQSHVRVQEDERKQLARELHGRTGPAPERHQDRCGVDPRLERGEDVRGEHGGAQPSCRRRTMCRAWFRDMLHRLRPVGLDELGLSAALEHLVEHWRLRNPAIRAGLAVTAAVDDLGERENITLYRIVQEGLNQCREACACRAGARGAGARHAGHRAQHRGRRHRPPATGHRPRASGWWACANGWKRWADRCR